ncbi:ABC-type branched-subunit amino acid transport system ATPase component [Mycolicibacterium iranicum]|uniref:ABC-type branched-subunit amino acid transport system ATPase component n=1 Tax=Mycolicibacterium iranicum TaxID=912594 RepID=A0A839QCR6_MYCIR|nr:ATP-binding cassette domain-containing protein [Mycolicibacterium iranicum]MBB2990301.1 ABC-type branched-subunit amino acid transport system ATPase component [Mycolicibacterium iranicum]
MLLEASGVSTGYGPLTVVRDATLTVAAGEIVAVVGPNGAGKSSLMKCIARSLPVQGGSLRFAGKDLATVAQNHIAQLGIGYVPQQGNVFPELSVQENLQVSCRGSLSEARTITKEVLHQFPRLNERIKQAAATLSGGERQMLAIACALVSSPSLLMLDEPTTGLAPLIVRERIADIQRLRDRGAGVLWIIEEHPRICLPAVDKVHFMSDGTLGPAMAAGALLEEGALEELFFGVSH